MFAENVRFAKDALSSKSKRTSVSSIAQKQETIVLQLNQTEFCLELKQRNCKPSQADQKLNLNFEKWKPEIDLERLRTVARMEQLRLHEGCSAAGAPHQGPQDLGRVELTLAECSIFFYHVIYQFPWNQVKSSHVCAVSTQQ